MRLLRIDFAHWREPLHPQQPGHPRRRVHLVRARNGRGTSPGWHLWLYTYPKGVQRGRLIAVYGRLVAT